VEKIITEIAEEFIKKIIEMIAESKKSFSEVENAALNEAKNCAAKVMSAYAEKVDAAIYADKMGRREMGYAVQRRSDERRLRTLIGEVAYQRTYYKKASGGYEYLADTALGIDRCDHISAGLSIALASAAKEMSYEKSVRYVVKGEVSRQTVMQCVRASGAAAYEESEKRKVAELHIDADEAHITLCGGRKSETPLISVYEGISRRGKRSKCERVFHISEYGKKPDELWEQALTEIERRYDLTDTKIYLHGDGANWIKVGLEWIPGAVFVLDKYHKNKAIKAMTAGLTESDRKAFDREIRSALDDGDVRFFGEITRSLCAELPERADKITASAAYLKNQINGISICKVDAGANNGGCTEPHVSHILSSRLSSRPMAWSSKTLKKLAPVLAAGTVSLNKKIEPAALPKPLRKAAASASKALRRGAAGLPHPDSIGVLPISGKMTGTQKILKLYR
jgi:hypothetical protein